MLIAQISDTHIETARPEAATRITNLERTVAAINALPERPMVVLHTGDIAHDATAEDYKAARAGLGRLNAPLYATVGNRDRRAAFRSAFEADGYLESGHPFAHYAVVMGGLRIVAADTLDDQSALGGFCADRAAGLARLLADDSGRPTLVFLHHPPVELADLRGPALQYREAAEAALLARTIAAGTGVIGVVAGHVHRSRMGAVGGVPLSTMPSIAADLSREKFAEGAPKRPVFHLHRVTAGGITTASVAV